MRPPTHIQQNMPNLWETWGPREWGDLVGSGRGVRTSSWRQGEGGVGWGTVRGLNWVGKILDYNKGFKKKDYHAQVQVRVYSIFYWQKLCLMAKYWLVFIMIMKYNLKMTLVKSMCPFKSSYNCPLLDHLFHNASV